MKFNVKVRDPFSDIAKIRFAVQRKLADVVGLSETERRWITDARTHRIWECAASAGGLDEKTIEFDTGTGKASIRARNN